MATVAEFIKAVNLIYQNHGIYLWGGNGEYVESLPIGKIKAMETSNENAARVLRHIALLYDQGYSLAKARACDCSGLVVAALRDCGAIKKTEDFRAKDLQKMATAVKLSQIKAGDLVFNKLSDASHVAIWDGEMVVESQGRDFGIVRRKLSEGPWMIGGRLKLFN